MQRSWREGWYGSGADYNFNPIMGWGDAPGESASELASTLARFDPQGLSQALGRDEDHTDWFAMVCDKLLPDYAFSLDWNSQLVVAPTALPIIPVRRGVPDYTGAEIPLPPGWAGLWAGTNAYAKSTPHASSSIDIPDISSGFFR